MVIIVIGIRLPLTRLTRYKAGSAVIFSELKGGKNKYEQ